MGDKQETNGHVSVGNDHSAGDSGMEDEVEFRVMMAYATRRRPAVVRDIPDGGAAESPASSPREPGEKEKPEKEGKKKKKKKKKNKGVRKFLSFLSCGTHVGDEQMQNGEEDDDVGISNFRCMSTDDADDAHVDSKEEMEEVASKLVKITDGISIPPPEIETDGEEDAVERVVGLLLRESGDRFNEAILKDTTLGRELFGNYSFFESVISTFLRRLGLGPSDPKAPDSQGSPKAQIALTCEVTCRLSAADARPMSHLVGFGAKYLKQHFSAWAAQQGGYAEALESEDDDDDDDDDEVE